MRTALVHAIVHQARKYRAVICPERDIDKAWGMLST
jgi:hypothetical protein